MTFKASIFFILSFILFSNCDSDPCSKNLDIWINEAPAALDEFHNIQNELKENSKFLNEHTFKGSFFICAKDTIGNFSRYELPLLKKWFKDGRSYISIKDKDTSFCFKECLKGVSTSYCIIENKKTTIENYKSHVEVVNNVNLKGNWHVLITSCDNCND